MTLRRLALLIAIAVFGLVPAALAVTADPFGPVEVADPAWWPGPLFNDAATFAGAGASGNVLLATIHRDEELGDQLAVLERCGGWKRTVLSAVDGGVLPGVLKVGADGTALATWVVGDTHYSSARPPGGSWGAPQTVASGVGFIRFAVSDDGDAIALWTAATGTSVSVRPAGGTWGAPEPVTGTTTLAAVAMSPAGDAVVAWKGSTPGYVFSRYRTAAGTWTGPVEVMRNAYQNTLATLHVEFDGDGRTVAVGDFRELDDTIRYNIGAAGDWGADKELLIDDDGNPPDPQYDLRNVAGLARHPDGLVATWTRANNTPEVVVARLDGTAWNLKVFQLPGSLSSPRLAVNAAGEILVAVDHFHDNVNDIRAAIAPSLGGAWPALALVSPAGTVGAHFRDPFAVAGAAGFAVGWGVHGGSNQRTEVVSTASCSGGTPTTPTPTASTGASADPDPLPQPGPGPAPAVAGTPLTASAFTTLPATRKCVRRGGKLAVRFKQPPAGYAVRSATVKLNAKTVATLRGKALRRPYYLRKLPKKAFTVTVSVKLTTGKSLTDRRRYKVCR